MRSRKPLPLLLALTSALILFPGCQNSSKAPEVKKSVPGMQVADADMAMPRADPAFLHYLEKQSMLTKSAEMAKVVSGSELAWKAAAGQGNSVEMLNFSDAWLRVNPYTMLSTSRSTPFAQLGQSSVKSVLREAGLKGLYVAPVRGNGALWAKSRPVTDMGEDTVQYEFSRWMGDENHYRRMVGSLMESENLIGSDMIPAATGLGPDFFLAARGVREYPGSYCMVEIPDKLWSNLPEAADEWDGVPLEEAQIAALNAQGLLPKSMRDDSSPLGRKGGWAATGKVRGVDGNTRRWVYRYYDTPYNAVLNWEDPSRSAHRIMSGSAVQQVGLLGQALVGLRFDAFQGLEVTPDKAGTAASFSVEPALSAAQSMTREVRRYGGWTWLRNEDLPLTAVRDFQRAGVDYVLDNAFSPSAEHALLTGDAAYARFMADELLRLNVDARRLVHTFPAEEGLDYAMPHISYLGSLPGGEKAGPFRQSILSSMRNAAAKSGAAPISGNTLYTTTAGLAAMALGINPASLSGKDSLQISDGQRLLVFFKAMQPGVIMINGQDMVGTLPLSPDAIGSTRDALADSVRGAYAMSASAENLPVNPLGRAKAPTLRPSPDVQVHDQTSFLRDIGSFMRARSEMGLARGSLAGRPATSSPGAIALLTKMPDGKSYLLSVCNFSRDRIQESLRLDGLPASALAHVTAIGKGGHHSLSGNTVTVTLGPWQARALLLGGTVSGVSLASNDISDEDAKNMVPEIPGVADNVASGSKPAKKSGKDKENASAKASRDGKKGKSEKNAEKREARPEKSADKKENKSDKKAANVKKPDGEKQAASHGQFPPQS